MEKPLRQVAASALLECVCMCSTWREAAATCGASAAKCSRGWSNASILCSAWFMPLWPSITAVMGLAASRNACSSSIRKPQVHSADAGTFCPAWYHVTSTGSWDSTCRKPATISRWYGASFTIATRRRRPVAWSQRSAASVGARGGGRCGFVPAGLAAAAAGAGFAVASAAVVAGPWLSAFDGCLAECASVPARTPAATPAAIVEEGSS
ncbi:hypothetical protein COO60DRAFT_1476582 [Scenedesmus sp. NREL 46B-D3]|nr:hypothetical protein COO60DRAFT_1476582 [Scenedesmus sp. NREL 46B-D3]